MARLAVRHRGQLRPRGSLDSAAPSILGQSSYYLSLLAALSDSDPSVRENVIVALGEWGDDQAARVLIKHLPAFVSDEHLIAACILALKLIGGPSSTEALLQIAETTSIAIGTRLLAISSLEEIVVGGFDDYCDRAPNPIPKTDDPNLSTKRIADRLRSLVRSSNTPYLAHKASRIASILAPSR